ncbi:MAG: nucleotidyl transferase AbiEii/AbiGii toxin family protein [Candidatus Aminicenantes bacterium]|nr:nucleotidyl transferase AbiEii/AbiGii toxin family protein [Candidatus Aminicenantes bacterium]
MKDSEKNLAESIRHRLRNRFKESGEDISFGLQRYASERFLYRLGESSHRDRFILKGAALFAIWGSSVYRPTRDLDFTGYGSSEISDIIEVFRDLCAMPDVGDGLSFDRDSVSAEPIRDEAEYHGLRVRFRALLGESKILMQVDIGFGNAVEPAPVEIQYPSLLDHPGPRIRAYPLEAVIAEKLHAMVVLGERNSRFKDFYDLYVFARQFPFKGEDLSRAIAATFNRRGTAIDAALPAAISPRFFAADARAKQWRAYLSRNSLPGAPADFIAAGESLQAFLVPLWRALGDNRKFSDFWPPLGPWTVSKASEDPNI